MADQLQPTDAAGNASVAEAGQGKLFPAWNTKKFREEYELAQAKLTDQRFNIAAYPEPLSPRTPASRPPGMSAETEARLQAAMAKIVAESKPKIV